LPLAERRPARWADLYLEALRKTGRKDAIAAFLAGRLERDDLDSKAREDLVYALIDNAGPEAALPYIERLANEIGGDWTSGYIEALKDAGDRDRLVAFVDSRLDALADLAKEAQEVRLPAGTALWREGDAASDLWILVAGVVDCASDDDRQRFQLGPGDAMGTLGALAQMPRWYGAEVSTDLVALRISVEALLDVFEDHFEMALDLIEGLADVILRIYEEVAASEAPPPA